MSDISAQAGLSVEVLGEENIQRLQAALQNLQQAGARVQTAVQAGGEAATAAAVRAGVADQSRQFQEGATNLGNRMGQRFASAVSSTIRAPFDVLRQGAAQIGRSLLGFTGGLGRMVSSAGPAAVAITGIGLAIAGLLAPVVSLIAGFKLLRTTFGWAEEAAQEQIRVAGRTRRFYPELIGQSLEGAEDEMRSRMGVATALFGEAADSMQESITRRLTNYRLGRGLRGERDIFRRWGITPENMQRYEDQAGRIDVSRWLHLFVLQREKLERDLESAQTPQQQAVIRRRMALLSDDTTKIFGQSFTDMMNALNSRDLVRLRDNMRRAIPLGHVDNATRRAADFTISLRSLQATFRAIIHGIGLDVAPAITDFMTELNRRLLDTKDGGEGLGRALRDLGSALALNAWSALRTIMDSIDTQRVRGWIETVNSWNAEETATTIRNLVTAVIGFGSAIARLVNLIATITGSYQEWKQGGGFFGRGGRTGEDRARSFYESQGREWTGAGGAEAAGGGPAAPAVTEAAPSTGSYVQPRLRRREAEQAGPLAAPGPPPAPAAPSVTEAGPSAPEPTQAAPPATGSYVQPRLRNRIQQEAQSAVAAQDVAAEEGTTAAGSIPPPVAPEAAAGETLAAPPPPPPPTPPAPVEAAPAAPPRRTFGERVQGGLRTMRNWWRPTTLTEEPQEPATAADQVSARTAMDTLKGTASGRAAALMTDVERGPGGTTDLVMRTSNIEPIQATPVSMTQGGVGAGATRWGLWGGGVAAEAAGLRGGAAIGSAIGRAGTMGEQPELGSIARGLVPGMGTLEMIKRDSEQGHPVRTRLREMLGIHDPGEDYDWRQPLAERSAAAEAGPSTEVAPGGFGWFPTSGGITAEDGANFGAAAAQQFRDGLDGVNLGGYAVTSQGVAPRSAPKPTGGDTATEA